MNSLINDLPVDLQEYIYKKVLEERKPKKILTKELKEDIESYFLFDHIAHNYKIMFNGKYHMDWVENAIINVMNDHQTMIITGIGGIYTNVHQDIKNAFPNFNDEEIAQTLMEESHIMRLWRHMPPKKRVDLYLESCDHIERIDLYLESYPNISNTNTVE